MQPVAPMAALGTLRPEHGRQVPPVVASEYEPSGHALQNATAGGAVNCPALQGRQELAPLSGLFGSEPAAHVAQDAPSK